MQVNFLAVTCALSLGLASCHLDFFSKNASEPGAGVPLTAFVATNGQYFPPFINTFFPTAKSYSREFPSLVQAQDQVTLIEVKPLDAGTSAFNEANLSWSADGAYLGYEVVSEGFRKIMLKDLAGNFSRELRVVPKGQSNFLDGMVIKSAQSYNAGLRWSRDSTRFAFMSNGGIGDYSIFLGAVGAPEASLGSSHSKDGYATWSPSTNELAFVSSRTGNGDIYLAELSTNHFTQLSTGDGVDLFPDWFPSGDAVVYSSGDALRHGLFVVSRKDHGAAWAKSIALTNWAHDDLRPTVSPDGRFVAFYTDATAPGTTLTRRWNIIVVPYEHGRTYYEHELSGMVVAKDVVIDLNTGPAWTSDSRKVFYVKHDLSVANPIYAYDLFLGRHYLFKTNTRMNRDILMSTLGVLSFRAQVGVWDRVFVALTNQGLQLQGQTHLPSKIHYLAM